MNGESSETKVGTKYDKKTTQRTNDEIWIGRGKKATNEIVLASINVPLRQKMEMKNPGNEKIFYF